MSTSGWLHPRVERHLISDEGEVIVDEVRRHPVALIKPVLIVLGGTVLFALMPLVDAFWWIFGIAGLIVVLIGLVRVQAVHMDRFVITNMRVFRVHGIFDRHLATMPMSRILDITVAKPLLGRIFGYGHFIFESAAQDQGLREIRYVGRPDERDLTIQRVLARAGLRGAGARHR
ncbi:MAG: PH domain-containing protein [Propionibacterium sp.]|nr:PH domain-containing protein [Propionibacterium sp.]